VQGAWAATFTEDFSSLPSDPVWKAPDHNWTQFSGVSSTGATSNSAVIGAVQSGGPAGKFGSYTGAEDAGALVANPNTLTGSWSFLMRINQTAVDARPADQFHSGQTGFFLGSATHANGGPAQARPDILIDTLDSGKMRIQFQRSAGNFADIRTLDVNTWYRYDFTYDYSTNRDWDMVISDLSGTPLIDEAGGYQGTTSFSTLNFAHWYKRSDAEDAATSPDFDIDQVNLAVPEPASATVAFGAVVLTAMRRRNRRPL
jgi:hypothetical protein